MPKRNIYRIKKYENGKEYCIHINNKLELDAQPCTKTLNTSSLFYKSIFARLPINENIYITNPFEYVCLDANLNIIECNSSKKITLKELKKAVEERGWVMESYGNEGSIFLNVDKYIQDNKNIKTCLNKLINAVDDQEEIQLLVQFFIEMYAPPLRFINPKQKQKAILTVGAAGSGKSTQIHKIIQDEKMFYPIEIDYDIPIKYTSIYNIYNVAAQTAGKNILSKEHYEKSLKIIQAVEERLYVYAKNNNLPIIKQSIVASLNTIKTLKKHNYELILVTVYNPHSQKNQIKRSHHSKILSDDDTNISQEYIEEYIKKYGKYFSKIYSFIIE